ncbi:23S rRNA (guanosine(2251)-2'-O)-methyltransferase RlmB [Candidatus Poribacteria bacterium]|nr:23S rRNA (guanosine(2251)-2'-O)-methyltransferase RlmB [Candidatus Poribacteria bacterium]
MSEDLVYGRNVVLEVLKSGQRKIKKIYLASSGKGEIRDKIVQLSKEKKISIDIVSPEMLDKIAHGVMHQGVIASVSEIITHDIDNVVSSVKNAGNIPFFLALNNIQDPHNIGALLRSADACNADGVIIPHHHNSPINATVVKTSSGASEYIPIIRENNLANILEKLKKQGVWIFGADMFGEQEYYNADFTLPLAIVLGNEGEGLQRLIKEKCDFLVKIPMKGRINSLNVSVAGALLMFEVLRQRNINKKFA